MLNITNEQLNFFKARIREKLNIMKPDIGEMRYKLYCATVEQCNEYEELKDMAELELQMEMADYSRSLKEKLNNANTEIKELRLVHDTNFKSSVEIELIVDDDNKKNKYTCSDIIEDLQDEETLAALAMIMNKRISEEPIEETYRDEIEQEIESNELIEKINELNIEDYEGEILSDFDLSEDNEEDDNIEEDDEGLDSYSIDINEDNSETTEEEDTIENSNSDENDEESLNDYDMFIDEEDTSNEENDKNNENDENNENNENDDESLSEYDIFIEEEDTNNDENNENNENNENDDESLNDYDMFIEEEDTNNEENDENDENDDESLNDYDMFIEEEEDTNEDDENDEESLNDYDMFIEEEDTNSEENDENDDELSSYSMFDDSSDEDEYNSLIDNELNELKTYNIKNSNTTRDRVINMQNVFNNGTDKGKKTQDMFNRLSGAIDKSTNIVKNASKMSKIKIKDGVNKINKSQMFDVDSNNDKFIDF